MKAKLGLAFRDAKETGLVIDSDVQVDALSTIQLVKKDRVSSLDIGVLVADAKRPKFLLQFNTKESADLSNFRVEYFKNGALRMFCIACDVKVEQVVGLKYSYELRYFFDNDCSFVKRKVKYITREHCQPSGGSSFSPDDLVGTFDLVL